MALIDFDDFVTEEATFCAKPPVTILFKAAQTVTMGGVPRIACILLAVLVLARATPASAGCSASGVTGSDNADDCAALLAAYAAWGNKPASWAAGIAAGTSYCDWDAYTIYACINGRVQYLCAAR